VTTGVVTSQNGVPVPDVTVSAADPATGAVQHGPTHTGPDGRFTLPVETGTFDFRFEPLPDSGLNAVVQQGVQVQGDLTINVQLSTAPTTPETRRFSGVVTTHDGRQLQGLQISLVGVRSSSNLGVPNGFAVDVPPGRYQNLAGTSGLFRTFVTGDYGYPHHAVIAAGPDAPSFDLSEADVTQDLRMPPTAGLDVTVLDAAGNPVPTGRPLNATGSSTTGFAFVPGAVPAYRFTSTAPRRSPSRTASRGCRCSPVSPVSPIHPAASACER
jgi:hypothetical protein